MRGKVSIIFGVGIVVVLLLFSNFVQAEEQKPQLFFVEEVVCAPSMAAEYEAYVKNVLKLLDTHSFPYPWTAFSTDDFHYFFVWQIDNFATLDTFFKALKEWEGKIGKESAQAIQETVVGTYKHVRYSCYLHVPDMSYYPESPKLKPGEAKFVYMGYCHVLGGKEEEVAKYFKKIGELCKEKNYGGGWDTYAGVFGADMPLYVYLEFGKSAGDFWTEADEFNEAHGKDMMEIWSKCLDLFRKYEFKTGMVRPDLSYMPQEK